MGDVLSAGIGQAPARQAMKYAGIPYDGGRRIRIASPAEAERELAAADGAGARLIARGEPNTRPCSVISTTRHR